jgi:hypothetical protein
MQQGAVLSCPVLSCPVLSRDPGRGHGHLIGLRSGFVYCSELFVSCTISTSFPPLGFPFPGPTSGKEPFLLQPLLFQKKIKNGNTPRQMLFRAEPYPGSYPSQGFRGRCFLQKASSKETEAERFLGLHDAAQSNTNLVPESCSAIPARSRPRTTPRETATAPETAIQ